MKSKNIKKIDFSLTLSRNTGYSLLYSKKLVQELIDILIQRIIENELIIKNIGSFKLIYKKERTGRNPKTFEEYKISERKTVSFSASKSLLRKINR